MFFSEKERNNAENFLYDYILEPCYLCIWNDCPSRRPLDIHNPFYPVVESRPKNREGLSDIIRGNKSFGFDPVVKI